MKYREAFAIGSKCEGIIKCTFARLYDEAGRALFSLQRKAAVEHLVLDGNSQTGELYAIGRETDKSTIDMWIPGVISDYENFATQGEINFDLPLVWIDEISDNRLVPAHFTDKAIEILTESLNNTRKVVKFTVWMETKTLVGYGNNNKRIYSFDKKIVKTCYVMTATEQRQWEQKGETRSEALDEIAELKQGEKIVRYKVTTESVLSPTYQTLIDIINSRGTIYIKPDAFEWYATDIKNVTVETTDPNGKTVTINLDEAIAAAKKKMDDAKRALLLVGATNVI